MPEEVVLRCRGVVRGCAEGEALVAPGTLSFWGEVDPLTGRVIAADHPLAGRTLGGKVLIIQSTKGSSATPLVMGLAHDAGQAPVALVNTQVDALAALACVVNRIPLVTDVEGDPFQLIRTGDRVVVDADEGQLVVTRQPQTR